MLETIEKEAVVQMILKKLAEILNSQESQKIGEVCILGSNWWYDGGTPLLKDAHKYI